MSSNSASRLPARERLTSQFGADGLWHARYPSADRTLCGVARVETRGRNWAPSCERCAAVARVFDAIDGSAPAHWDWKRLPMRVAERALERGGGVTRALVALLVLVAVCAGAARATTSDPRLNAVASRIAQQPVSVLCYAAGEAGAPADVGAWGYVFPVEPVEHMDPLVCAGALAVADGDATVPFWEQALGALVLTHESYHLRLSLADRTDEAATECRAIRHVRYVMGFLGASASLEAELMPFALALHWNLVARAPAYYASGCKSPWWWSA